MKRLHGYLTVALVSCWASATLAVPIVTADDVDMLVASARISPSNPHNEEVWVTAIVGDGLISGARIDDSDGWLPVGAGVFAFEAGTGTDYFLVKTGAGHPEGHTHFLYRNTSQRNYAVIDLGLLGFDPAKVDVDKIGYYTPFRPLTVAEPGSLALLGTGLLGLGLLARRPVRRDLVSA